MKSMVELLSQNDADISFAMNDAHKRKLARISDFVADEEAAYASVDIDDIANMSEEKLDTLLAYSYTSEDVNTTPDIKRLLDQGAYGAKIDEGAAQRAALRDLGTIGHTNITGLGWQLLRAAACILLAICLTVGAMRMVSRHDPTPSVSNMSAAPVLEFQIESPSAAIVSGVEFGSVFGFPLSAWEHGTDPAPVESEFAVVAASAVDEAIQLASADPLAQPFEIAASITSLGPDHAMEDPVAAQQARIWHPSPDSRSIAGLSVDPSDELSPEALFDLLDQRFAGANPEWITRSALDNGMIHARVRVNDREITFFRIIITEDAATPFSAALSVNLDMNVFFQVAEALEQSEITDPTRLQHDDVISGIVSQTDEGLIISELYFESGLGQQYSFTY